MEAVMESHVSFRSADGAITLAGTLTIPSTGRDAPAVILVSGTGPMDRDVTFVGHTLFRVTARGLARAGIASLRFDKRGVGESEGDFSSARPEDFVADVMGATDFLVDGEGFTREHTGLLGHSEGGFVALTAASKMQRVPFCVILASPLLSGTDNFIRSLALLARGSLNRDTEYDQFVSDLAALLETARSEEALEQDPRALEIAARLAPRVFNERTAVILGSTSMSGAEFLKLLSSPCLETCLSWDPSRVVPLLTCPVLVVYASKDVQAPARENLVAAHALLRRLRKTNWEILEMADMNHAFQRCTTGMPDEYESIDHVMAGEVLNEVSAWINSKIPG
jgi:alpha-beta hydrolase superfamily lysophospholipase